MGNYHSLLASILDIVDEETPLDGIEALHSSNTLQQRRLLTEAYYWKIRPDGCWVAEEMCRE